MWIEEITLENIKCYEKLHLKMGKSSKPGTKPHKWITLLGENGTGKSTILQAMAVLLAGPEGAKNLLARPEGWVKDETQPGKITIEIHQSDCDPGQYGTEKQTKNFAYMFYVTGDLKININNQVFTEPTILPHGSNTRLTWLRENALLPKGKGWFAAGYGAFRRLTRESRVLVPSLQNPLRYTNFFTQFYEDKPLEAFEQWLVYLDFQILKLSAPEDHESKRKAQNQKEMGIDAINKLLPQGNRFSSIDSQGRIWFDTPQGKVSTIALSDGFRSILALAGDLVWRLIEAFPDSDKPLEQEGVVLIDELDIHLHPSWQREIAGILRKIFPNIQFIVTTHSPFIAMGAGEDAIHYKISRNLETHKMDVSKIVDIDSYGIDKVLQSPAFGIVSIFSPQTQEQIEVYKRLHPKKRSQTLSKEEDSQYQLSLPFVTKALGYGNEPSILEVENFLAKKSNK